MPGDLRRPSAIGAILLLAGIGALVAGAALVPVGHPKAAAGGVPLLRSGPLEAVASAAERADGLGRPGSTAGRAARDSVPALPERLGWIAVGGGAEPSSNQVSLEQDLRLARQVLEPKAPGLVLFAGGPGSMVLELDRRPGEAALRQELGELLDPREDRASVYRQSSLVPDGAATERVLRTLLEGALAEREAGPLLLFVASHGNAADKPRDDAVWLWGAQSLSAADLVGVLDAAPASRPVLLVMSSCFSGGFAELVFAGADSAKGSARPSRCGLFASTWDREAAGCDPNPSRRQQQSYGLYFLNALRSADREGRPLAAAAIDFDHDGRVSPLEAHAHVRIAARSISVPTTTSERWLREVGPRTGAERRFAWPEEEAVVRELGRSLGLGDAVAVQARRAMLDGVRATADSALQELEQERDERLRALQLVLLERWPELDDAWRSDFAPTLARDREAISALLEGSEEARSYRAAEDAVARASQGYAELEEQLALVERLVRAHENLELSARLEVRGGAGLEHFRQLLACERGWPGQGR